MVNRILRYLIYGTSSIIVSEIVYHTYRWFRKRRNSKTQEVIWTNELTHDCPCIFRRTFFCSNAFCFNKRVKQLIALIDQTSCTIDLAMYCFTQESLAQAIGKAIDRGVVVRIICDKEMYCASSSQLKFLKSKGADVIYPKTAGLMHHKFCILDGPSRVSTVKMKKKFKKIGTPVLLNGSLNWTFQGFVTNFENIVISFDRSLVMDFEKEFERIWGANELFSLYGI